MVDVVVIGSGIMGAAAARELSKYNLNIIVLEKEHDVSNGTTKANSAIIHAGYDAQNGTLMAKYNALGNAMFDDLCKEIDAPFRRCGSFVLAFSEEEKEHLKVLYDRGIKNGIPGIEILEGVEVLKREPNINKEVVAALYAPTAGVIGPWEFTIKLLENAAENGVDVQTDSKVLDIKKLEEGYLVKLEDREILTKTIINASGVFADELNAMVSNDQFKIIPRKGEYFLLDKVQGTLTNSVIFQCPTALGKGVLVAQTIHGNLITGPTALDIDDKEDVSNTVIEMDVIKKQSVKSIPEINFRDNIRNFAGLRAESDRGDFIIGEAPDAQGFFNIAGTKSPGLSSAPAIALEIATQVLNRLGDVTKKEVFKQNRPQIHFMELPPEEKAKVIAEDPRYGRIICRCENITEGEIIDVIHRMVGAKTVDGIKKRCRPGSGRCQGGFCGPRVQEILARELETELDEIVLDKKGAYILTGKTK